MALKLTLKPHERLIIGGAVITVGHAKCDLIIENNVPILRERDILREVEADSPCRRIYFIIQVMYIDQDNLAIHHQQFWEVVREVVIAAPSTIPLIGPISDHIVNGKYYQALKLAKKLIQYEQGVLLKHADISD